MRNQHSQLDTITGITPNMGDIARLQTCSRSSRTRSFPSGHGRPPAVMSVLNGLIIFGIVKWSDRGIGCRELVLV